MVAASCPLSAQSKCFSKSILLFLAFRTAILAMGIPTSVGITASISYVRANGVALIGFLLVV